MKVAQEKVKDFAIKRCISGEVYYRCDKCTHNCNFSLENHSAQCGYTPLTPSEFLPCGHLVSKIIDIIYLDYLKVRKGEMFIYSETD